MKRRYSPAARRAHLRAMHNRPSEVYIVEMDPKDPIAKLIESYEQGFLTAVELADLILETLPQPEPAPMPRKCGLGWCHNAALDGYAVCAEHLPQQPEPAPMSEQPIDCDCPACLAEQQPALQGRCIGCGVLTPDGVDVDVDGLFGQDWCCEDCQKEPWAKPIEGRYSFDPEGGAA